MRMGSSGIGDNGFLTLGGIVALTGIDGLGCLTGIIGRVETGGLVILGVGIDTISGEVIDEAIGLNLLTGEETSKLKGTSERGRTTLLGLELVLCKTGEGICFLTR
jgi:hypothetical protein